MRRNVIAKNRLTESQLEDVIKQHKRWLLSGEEIPGSSRVIPEGGTPASFVDTDLRGLHIGGHLSGVSFMRADLEGASFIYQTLDRASFRSANLEGANLQGAKLFGAEFDGAKLSRASFYGADLRNTSFKNATLEGVSFNRADLRGQDFRKARLHNASLCEADLRKVDLRDAYLTNADFSGADLTGADLSGAYLYGSTLVDAVIEQATFTGSQVYGMSVWDVKGEPRDQSSLIITPKNEENSITVDSLEVAQFIYLLLNNAKVRQVVDAVTSKVVLILGRFSTDRKKVLDAIRVELRGRDFTPVMFDFEKPGSKDVTGTVETLARMARFIIADVSDPSSVPHELATIVPFLRTTPVLPLRLVGATGYSLISDLEKAYPWVLETHEYDDGASLIAALPDVISPADEMAEELRAQV